MLKWPKRIIQIAWYILMVLIGAGIAIYNDDPVTVKFFSYEFESISLGIVLCLMLVLGAFLGFFTAQFKVWQQKRKTRKAEKEVAKLKRVEHGQTAGEFLESDDKLKSSSKAGNISNAVSANPNKTPRAIGNT